MYSNKSIVTNQKEITEVRKTKLNLKNVNVNHKKEGQDRYEMSLPKQNVTISVEARP